MTSRTVIEKRDSGIRRIAAGPVEGIHGLRRPCVREHHREYLIAEKVLKWFGSGIKETFENGVWKDDGSGSGDGGDEMSGDAWDTDCATKLSPISRPDLEIKSSASIYEGEYLTSDNTQNMKYEKYETVY